CSEQAENTTDNRYPNRCVVFTFSRCGIFDVLYSSAMIRYTLFKVGHIAVQCDEFIFHFFETFLDWFLTFDEYVQQLILCVYFLIGICFFSVNLSVNLTFIGFILMF